MESTDQSLIRRFQVAADILEVSQERLAKILGTSRAAVSDLLNGKYAPSEKQVICIEKKARDKQDVLQELDDELRRLRESASK